MRELANKIREFGKVVCVGSGPDKVVPCDIDLRNKTDINQLAYVIKHSKLFVGIDSCPFHVAQAVGTPGVVFFGSIKPELRIVNDNMEGVTAKNLICLGCHHRKPAPSVVTHTCETNTFDCENWVTVDQMYEAISRKLNKKPKKVITHL